MAPSVPPTSSSPKPCVRRLPGGPTRGPTIVNKLRCPSVTVTSGPVAPTTNSAATTIPLKYADRSLRDFLSEGKLLKKFSQTEYQMCRNVTIQDVKWEQQCDQVEVTRKDCRTEIETREKTVKTQKCHQYEDEVCVNYNVPSYEVVISD